MKLYPLEVHLNCQLIKFKMAKNTLWHHHYCSDYVIL